MCTNMPYSLKVHVCLCLRGQGHWLWITCLTSLLVRILTGTLDSFMWRSYPHSLRNICGSTRLLLFACNNSWRSLWGLPLPVKSGKIDIIPLKWRWYLKPNLDLSTFKLWKNLIIVLLSNNSLKEIKGNNLKEEFSREIYN